MKTTYLRAAGAVCFSLLLLLISCNSDTTPSPAVAPAEINGMELTLVPVGGGATVKAICGDNNGYTDYQDLNLQPNTVYDAQLTFYHNSQGIKTDQTQEVKNNTSFYKIILQKSSTAVTAGIPATTYTIEPLDKDNRDKPIYLKFKLTTGQIGIGSLGINLNYSNRSGSSSYYGDAFTGSYFIMVQE